MGSILFFTIWILILCQILSFDRFDKKRTHWVMFSTSTRKEPNGSRFDSYISKNKPTGSPPFRLEKRTHWVIFFYIRKNEPTGSPPSRLEKGTHWVIFPT